jgi:iron complex outermembrane receptor protein
MKKVFNLSVLSLGIPKFDLKMKLSFLFLFAMVFALQANTSYSQTTKITLKMENVRVSDVIDKIELETEFKFLFNTKVIDLNRMVSINYRKQTIDKILFNLFNGTDTDFEIDNRKVLLFKRQKIGEVPTTTIQEEVQTIINGTVKDLGGVPLPGANIVEKGTTNGAQTDFDGNFSLEPQGENPVLVISYVGFATQEIVVGSQTNLNIVLQEDAAGLEEVVLIGYASVAKRDVTGSVSTVKAESFNQGVVTSPELLVQGKSPGVQITSDGGEPGGSVNVRIRGTSSVRSGNGPLYVINGVPLSGAPIAPSGANVGGNDAGAGSTTPKNPLSFLNPRDIVSLDILKDASATAIYGSRGANGVIIITTKSGRSSQNALTYSTSVGVSNITQELPLLTAAEFVGAGGNDLGADTDWQDVVYRTALAKNHHISYGGGSEDGKSTYSISFGSQDQDGIVEGSGTKVYTGTINTSFRLFDDKLNLTAFVAGANILDNNPQISNDAGVPGDLLGAANRANPSQPIFNPDGTFVQDGVSELNPAAILAFSRDNSNTFRILANMTASYSITDNLTYKFNFGIDRSDSERISAVSSDLVAAISSRGGIVTSATAFQSNLLLEHTLNYNIDLDEKNRIGALAGYSYQGFNIRSSVFTTENFQTNDLDVMINNLESAATAVGRAGEAASNASKDELQSFFGRVNYSYDGKYLLTATLRADGSSKFGENNRYGYFPSVAFAWRLSDEEFIPESISDLKFRVGYGITGNQEFPGGAALTIQRFDRNNNLSAPRFSNPDLRWEQTSQLNAGIDFAFADSRIRGSFDLYRKTTTDLLLQLDSALPAPAPFFFANLDAEVLNQGFEFGIEGDIVSKENVSWTSSFNIGYNKNEVTRIDRTIQTGAISGPGLTGAFAQVITEGAPLYSYFIPEFSGFDENGFSIESEARLLDKSPLPDFTYGFSNYLKIKDFDVNIFFAGQAGAWIYNNNANAQFYRAALAGGHNVTRNILNNGEADTNGNGVSTRFLENGSFLRLQNLAIGYNFNTDKLKFVDKMRLSLTGQNLFTITGYSGQDPEVNVDKSINGVPSFGIDYSAYPRARTITAGLDITF